MVSLLGFSIAAAFVSVEGFELPYYVALIGACGLKIAYLENREGIEPAWDEAPWAPSVSVPHTSIS
jgi:hypothetical protein